MIDWLTIKFDNNNEYLSMFRDKWKPELEKSGQVWTFLQFSGQWFQTNLDADADARRIIMDARKYRGKVTRVDFALDIPVALHYRQLYHELKSAMPRCHVHTWESRTGTTVYVGTRTSQRFLRIYDKRGETIHKTGLDCGFDWCRVELEVKRYAVDHYLDKWLVNPNDVVSDIITRYGLAYKFPDIKTTGDLIIVPQLDVESDAMRFVKRYHKILHTAYTEDSTMFMDIVQKGSETDDTQEKQDKQNVHASMGNDCGGI